MAKALKKVRVLTDHWNGERTVKHGEVVEMDEDAIKASLGAVDPHADAVAYQEKVNAEDAAEAAKKKA